MDNLEEMERLLEKFNHSGLNQEEIEMINNPITSTDFEAVIKNFLKKKTKSRTRWFLWRILSNIQTRANAYPSKTLKKLQRKEHFQTHSTRPPSP